MRREMTITPNIVVPADQIMRQKGGAFFYCRHRAGCGRSSNGSSGRDVSPPRLHAPTKWRCRPRCLL